MFETESGPPSPHPIGSSSLSWDDIVYHRVLRKPSSVSALDTAKVNGGFRKGGVREVGDPNREAAHRVR